MGTNVLPGYQRMAVGKFLTRNYNEIANKSGDRTWIPASLNGYGMFKSMGFKEVAVFDAHLEQCGFDPVTGKLYIIVRDPPPSSCASSQVCCLRTSSLHYPFT
jgi:hypothetical protein